MGPVGLNLEPGHWWCVVLGIQTHTSINLININKSRLLLDKDNREERLLEMNGNEWQWPYIHLTARENVTEIEDPLERVFFENDSEVKRNGGNICENCICRRLESICSCKNGETN